MKKKLLVTASTFPRWENDTEPRFVLDYAKAMKRYYDVTVLVPAATGAKDREILEGVKVIRYHYLPIHRFETLCYPGAIVPRIKEKKSRILLVPFLIISLYWSLFRFLPRFDVVHAHWLIPQGVVQSLFNKKYIVTGHGGDVTSLNKGIIKKMKIRCLKKASAVTVVSEALKEEVISLWPCNNLEVISMGCDIHNFGRQYRVDNYFNQNNKKVILFVGRLAEKKGVSYLIEAIKQIDAKLVIVGSGPLESELKKQSIGYEKKIQFLGPKTHEELREIYASADIFVAPSITAKDGDKEGFGLVLLEAMASGLPVIGSNSGGIPSIVHHGKNGFLVKEKDVNGLIEKIKLLLCDEKLYFKLAQQAYKDVQQYDYQNIAKRYAKLIDSLNL